MAVCKDRNKIKVRLKNQIKNKSKLPLLFELSSVLLSDYQIQFIPSNNSNACDRYKFKYHFRGCGRGRGGSFRSRDLGRFENLVSQTTKIEFVNGCKVVTTTKIYQNVYSNTFEKIFIPIYEQLHFILGVIDITNSKIIILDSLNYTDLYKKNFRKIYRVLQGIAKIDRRIKQFEFITPKNTPEQPNGFDCGVYICQFVEYINEKNLEIFEYGSEYKRFLMNTILDMNLNITENNFNRKLPNTLDLVYLVF